MSLSDIDFIFLCPDNLNWEVAEFQGLLLSGTGIKHLQSPYILQEQEKEVQLAHKKTVSENVSCVISILLFIHA